MVKSYRELISLLFSFCIIALTGLVTHEFFLSLIWAGVLAIATWPLYVKLHKVVGGRDIVAASVLIALVTLVIAAPFLWGTKVIASEAQTITKFLMHANQHGLAYPEWLENLPFLGSSLKQFWQETLAQPRGLQSLSSKGLSLPLQHVTHYARTVTVEIAHRAVVLGFTIMSLFFFYKDGFIIKRQIAGMGHYFVGDRWHPYSANVPGAIKATVNGLVLVGIGVGVIMGGLYMLVGLPAPVTFGCITAVFAMIPLAVPIAFGVIAAILVIQSKLFAALGIIVCGTVVMFIADHFVRPVIIGGATRLPFLGVLFGILGGVKTFGVVGLFIGPVVMVLFVTLWHEADIFQETEREFIEQIERQD